METKDVQKDKIQETGKEGYIPQAADNTVRRSGLTHRQISRHPVAL